MLILVNNERGAEVLNVRLLYEDDNIIKCEDQLGRELVILIHDWDYIAYNGERLWVKV